MPACAGMTRIRFAQDSFYIPLKNGASYGKRGRVRVATTANITLSGTQTIDAIAAVAGDLVLVKDQSTQSQNGIYTVAVGAWARDANYDIWSEIEGCLIAVEE